MPGNHRSARRPPGPGLSSNDRRRAASSLPRSWTQAPAQPCGQPGQLSRGPASDSGSADGRHDPRRDLLRRRRAVLRSRGRGPRSRRQDVYRRRQLRSRAAARARYNSRLAPGRRCGVRRGGGAACGGAALRRAAGRRWATADPARASPKAMKGRAAKGKSAANTANMRTREANRCAV